MKFLSTHLLKKIKCHIANGGILAYPTEYCFGLGCDYKNVNAVKKIINLKSRNSNKGMIIISGNISHFKSLININNTYSEYWPGAFTLLLNSDNRFIKKLVSGRNDKIALRITKHQLVTQICDYLNQGIISTSANYSGRFPAKTYKECCRIFGKKIMIVPGLTNFRRMPSSIIEYETKKVLR